MATPKTVFVAPLHGVAARVLLRSGILEPLRAAGVRIVVLAPNADEAYMAEELGEGDILEPLHSEVGSSLRSRIWAALVTVRHYVLAGGHRATTIEDKYGGFRARYRRERPWSARLVGIGLRVLWRSRLARRALLRVESLMMDSEPHRELFERYRPDLVVLGSPGWFMADAIVQLEAARRNVPRVGVVLGWDNPTSKGYRGPGADRVVVWSEAMSRQMANYHDFPPGQVFVGGPPHFDHYLRRDALWSREQLCASLELDAERALIVLATSSPGRYEHSAEIAGRLADAITAGALPPAQLVVRLHPNHLSPLYSVSLDAYRELAERWPHVSLDVPEVRSRRLRVDVSPDDAIKLAALLAHADVLVNGFSTTTLEAFLVDTPVVTFTPTAHLLKEYMPDSRKRSSGLARGEASGEPEPSEWENFTHLQGLVQSGASRIARSLEEVVEQVGAYLADPALDREERRLVARTECGPTDGQAGERIGRHLLEVMAAKRR